MKTVKLLMICLLLLALSCKKPEGEGGSASIKGTVWMQNWNSTYTFLESEYPATDEYVYIIYGDNTSYGDRIKTNYDGRFEFKYLREGTYKIYVYSKDKTLQSPSGTVAVIKEVKITSRKQSIETDTLVIYN